MLQSCAAIPVAAVSGAVLSSGGSAIVKTGTQYTASGAVVRTFTVPVDDVHSAVVEAFQRTDVAIVKDEASPKKGIRIAAKTPRRKISVQLTDLSPKLTAMELNVKRNFLASDKSTVSELLAQVEQVLAERRQLVTDVKKVTPGAAKKVAAESPAPCDHVDGAQHESKCEPGARKGSHRRKSRH